MNVVPPKNTARASIKILHLDEGDCAVALETRKTATFSNDSALSLDALVLQDPKGPRHFTSLLPNISHISFATIFLAAHIRIETTYIWNGKVSDTANHALAIPYLYSPLPDELPPRINKDTLRLYADMDTSIGTFNSEILSAGSKMSSRNLLRHHVR
ncbi:hypothetical protein RJ035_005646 [Blastomyces gilchristii]